MARHRTPVLRYLLLLFIAVPVVEMWLLIEVGSAIGAWPTIGLVLLTAVVGVSLLRREGLKTLIRGNRRLEQGELPAREMLDGLVIAVSGAMFLTPGFVTDFVGLIGLLPFTRSLLVSRLLASGNLEIFSGGLAGTHQGSTRDEKIIEAEYWRDDNNPKGP